jgi:hypothetical protein
VFVKRPRESWSQWDARRVCSRECRPSLEARLWAQIERGGRDECWPWLGGVTSTGRGQIRLGDETRCPVHVAVYELLVGPIPAGHEIHHECEMAICCNPAHMRLLTKAAHTRITDGGAFNRTKTTCPEGHLYDEANTYIHRGRRGCKVCRQAAVLRYRKRRALGTSLP